jgi:hypothetical protein
VAKLNCLWDSNMDPAIAPGAPNNPLLRLARAIKAHLITVTLIWPNCAAYAQLNGEYSIISLIDGCDDIFIADYAPLFHAIGGVQLGLGGFAGAGLALGNQRQDADFHDQGDIYQGGEDSADSDIDMSEDSQ